MGSTARRNSSGITTTSQRSGDPALARPWPLPPTRGANGGAARSNNLRAVKGATLEAPADPRQPAFAAAEAIARALGDSRREGIGVVGAQAAIVAAWLRRSGHDAQTWPASGKKTAREKRGPQARTLSAIVALDCMEPGTQNADRLKRIRQLLPPDGQLVAVVPNATHVSVRLAMLLGRYTAFAGDAVRTHAATLEDAERFLSSAGFVVTGVERQIDSLDALTKSGNGLPDAVLHLLGDDAEAMTSHFVFVAERDGAASTARLVERRLGELAGEQQAVVIQAARLNDRVSDLEARVRHWNSETERLAGSAVPMSEALAILETRLHQLASNQSDLATTATNAASAVERIEAEMRGIAERAEAAATDEERTAKLREARDRCLARAEEVAALARRIEQAQYRRVIARLREVVERETTRGATVAVVSRGDAELLAFAGRRGWHFPQTERGVYAGHHPADSTAAIAHVDELRARGAGYLLVPRTALWWLDYYKDFHQHLLGSGRCLARDERWGALFALAGRRRRQ